MVQARGAFTAPFKSHLLKSASIGEVQQDKLVAALDHPGNGVGILDAAAERKPPCDTDVGENTAEQAERDRDDDAAAFGHGNVGAWGMVLK